MNEEKAIREEIISITGDYCSFSIVKFKSSVDLKVTLTADVEDATVSIEKRSITVLDGLKQILSTLKKIRNHE